MRSGCTMYIVRTYNSNHVTLYVTQSCNSRLYLVNILLIRTDLMLLFRVNNYLIKTGFAVCKLTTRRLH